MSAEVGGKQVQSPPDIGTQVRQWLGLVIAIGGVAYLVDAGKTLGRIEKQVEMNAASSLESKAELKRRTAVFEDIRKIAAAQDGRLVRLETIHELEAR